MKVLLLIPSLGSGGAERQLVSLGILFKKKGIDVEFLIYFKDDFYKHILDENLIKVNFVSSKNNFERIFKIRNFIINSKSDIVVSFLETPDFLNCISSIGFKKWKVITTELSSKKSTFETLRGKLFGWFRRHSNYIVCNSYNSLNLWKSYYPLYLNKLEVIYNPVILPNISSTYQIRRNNKLNLVVAASYQYLKNPIGLINALIIMDSNKRKNLKIDWYGRVEVTTGDTRAYDEAKDLISKNNLNDIIHLHGPTKDIANIMNASDIVGLFSSLEGLPNAICEAMMIGKPVIMTKVSDYDNLIDENNGFLCDWDNPVSIRNALEKAMDLSDSEIINFGINSKNKAEKLFSPQSIVDKWLNLFG